MPLPEKNFLSEWLFQDLNSILNHKRKTVLQIKDNCYIFLDANVLLAPYRLDASSLQEIEKIYSRLRAEKRLFVPAQAMREYIKNRVGRITELVQIVRDQSSAGSAPKNKAIKALDGNVLYSKALSLAANVEIALKAYRKAVDELVEDISSWADADDPVFKSYHNIIGSELIDVDFDEAGRVEFSRELKIRSELKVPPGYKDASKSDEGAGDLLIWKTILEKARKDNKDAIFVTFEEKPDWFIKGGGLLLPRPELVEEFRRVSSGRDIHIISLSAFLNIFEADPNIVAAAEVSESIERSALGVQHSSMSVVIQERIFEIENEQSRLMSALNAAQISSTSLDSLAWHNATPTIQGRLTSLRDQKESLVKKLKEIEGQV